MNILHLESCESCPSDTKVCQIKPGVCFGSPALLNLNKCRLPNSISGLIKPAVFNIYIIHAFKCYFNLFKRFYMDYYQQFMKTSVFEILRPIFIYTFEKITITIDFDINTLKQRI